MKTAVEFLANVWAVQGKLYTEDIEQAKEMEKQQRVDAFDDGFQQGVQCMTCIYSEKVWDGVDDGEEYVKVQDWSSMRIRNL